MADNTVYAVRAWLTPNAHPNWRFFLFLIRLRKKIGSFAYAETLSEVVIPAFRKIKAFKLILI
jgi:hypothetical protein